MPDQTHPKKDMPKAAFPEPAKGWDGQLASLLAVNERAFRSWARGVSAFAEEMTRFTEERLREDGAAWQVLATCRSPIDALECQRRFAAKATEQYLAEAGKLSEIAMTLASESLAALQSGAGEQSFRRTDAATQAGAARATVA